MAAQNFKEEDWGDGDSFRGRNWAKNFQAWNVFEKEADENVNHSGEEYSSQEIDNFIHGQKSKNTVKKKPN